MERLIPMGVKNKRQIKRLNTYGERRRYGKTLVDCGCLQNWLNKIQIIEQRVSGGYGEL